MLKKKKNIISIKVDIMTKYQCLRIRKNLIILTSMHASRREVQQVELQQKFKLHFTNNIAKHDSEMGRSESD